MFEKIEEAHYLKVAKESFKASEDFLRGREDLHGVDVLKEWRLLLTKNEIQSCIEHCANVIQEKFRDKPLVIVCILKGCVYFFTKLTTLLTIPHSAYMLEMASYHDVQTQSAKIEILSLIQPNKFKDKYVVILDELLDNGNTMETAKQYIIKEGNVPPEKVFTCTLFKKDHETKCPPVDIYGITIGNLWSVGCGLDDRQEKRNWEYLYACPKDLPEEDKDPADEIFTNDEFYGKERSKLIKICDDHLHEMIKRDFHHM